MKSIKTFLLFWVLGGIAIGTITLSIISYYIAEHEVEELFDAEMVQTAKYLTQFSALSLTKNNSAKQKQFHEYENKIAYKIYDNNLILISQSSYAPAFLFVIKKQGFITQKIEGILWHLFVYFEPKSSTWIIVSQQDKMREELTEYLLQGLLFPFILGIPILMVLVWYILLLGLKPLLFLAQAIEKRKLNNLSPIKLQSSVKEIKPIVLSLNHLFSEVSRGIEKEKRFTADAAHELRTPLSILKIHAQNAYACKSLEKAKKSINLLLQGVDNSTHLIEQLLKLTRLDPIQQKQDFSQVNFSQLIKMEVAKQYPSSLIKNQVFEINLPNNDLFILGIEFTLQLMLKNLIENAIRYTPTSGSITINLYQEKIIIFSIKNSGELIKPADKNRLFERFFRISANQTKGSGLGMSIIKQCVDIHNAKIELPETDSGLDIRIKFNSF